MRYVLGAVGAVVVLVIAFLLWRIMSVVRGARRRDARLLKVLAPLGEKLSQGAAVASSDVARLGSRYELRPMLHALLKRFGRLDLFPSALESWERQAEGLLAYWMMHPHELQDPPIEMECVERLERDLQGKTATFLVVRYRMPEGHWSGHAEWHVGVAGPFLEKVAPYEGIATAFSRCGDTLESIAPGALVDRFVAMCAARATEGAGQRSALR